MIVETLKFKIGETLFSISALHIRENNTLYDIKNMNNGTWKTVSKVELEKIFKKYDAKFVY